MSQTIKMEDWLKDRLSATSPNGLIVLMMTAEGQLRKVNYKTYFSPFEAQRTEDTDMDEMKTPGRYWLIKTKIPNSPVQHGILTVTACGTDIIQEVVGITGEYYTRHYHTTSGWKSWKQATMTTVTV